MSPAPRGTRPLILVFGNCQAAPLAQILRKVPSVGTACEVHAIATFDMEQHRPARFLDAIDMGRAVLLLAQRDTADPVPSWVTERLPSGAGVLRFAALDTELLWPFRCRDPRNHPEPDHKFGRYPYGDRLVVDLLKTGLAGAALFDAYMEQSTARLKTGMAALRRGERHRLNARDAGLAVGAADLVLDQIRHRPLFNTCDHPTGRLLRQFGARLLAATRRALGLGGDANEVDTHMPHFDPLSAHQLPIHPAIARGLRLDWWKPGQTYRQPDGQMLNFRQYIRRYIDFA